MLCSCEDEIAVTRIFPAFGPWLGLDSHQTTLFLSAGKLLLVLVLVIEGLFSSPRAEHVG
jgi:hypothetical protein